MRNFKAGIIDTTDINIGMMVRIFIVVLVLAAGAMVFWKSRSISDVNLASTMMNAMRNHRNSDGYGTGDYSEVLIKSGEIPSSATVTNGQIYNSAGYPISIVGQGIGFSLTETGLSDKGCVNLATKLGTADLSSTQINGQSIAGEVTSQVATSACTGGNNTVVFSSRY
jgi:hypothetical protein